MGQPNLLPISWPLHDVPVGKSPSWQVDNLFVYVGHDSRTPFYGYGNYLYVLLKRPTYLYTYTITVSAATITPITAITITTLIHKPTLFIVVVLLYLPSYLLSVYIYRILAALYLRGETRGSLFRKSWTLIYVYIYLYELRILIVVDLRGETGGTLFCCGWPLYICILAVAVVRSSSAVRSWTAGTAPLVRTDTRSSLHWFLYV